MEKEILKILGVGANSKESQKNPGNIRRPGRGDLRIASHDDGIAVMPRMRPPPDHAFSENHEGGDLVEDTIHPIRLECCPVQCFMPTGVGTTRVNRGIDQIRKDRPQ